MGSKTASYTSPQIEEIANFVESGNRCQNGGGIFVLAF
jgi:hypothetical protein